MRLSSLGCERWRKRMYPGCTSWCPPTSRCSPWRTQWQVQLIQVLIESEAVARTSLTSHCFSAWFWGPQTARKCLLTDKAYESTVHLVWVLSQQSQGSSSCIPNSQQMRQDGDTAGGECEKLGPRMHVRKSSSQVGDTMNFRFRIPKCFFGRSISFWLLVPVEECWISRLFFWAMSSSLFWFYCCPVRWKIAIYFFKANECTLACFHIFSDQTLLNTSRRYTPYLFIPYYPIWILSPTAMLNCQRVCLACQIEHWMLPRKDVVYCYVRCWAWPSCALIDL